jgi:signal transduction histidine kinase
MFSSLFARLALILLGTLALAHALTYVAILRERGDLAQTMMLGYLGRDVAASVAVLDRVPAEERAQWLPRLERQNYRYRLERSAPAPAPEGELPQRLSAVVASQLGADRVGPMSQDTGGWQLPLRLADGSPLTLSLTPPQLGVSAGTLALLALQFAVLALAAWWAVRLATRPLTRLADAADALGGNTATARLPEDGPREVAHAAHAFNTMQQRIAQHIAERVHTLAAISHDLQTPLTRLRLRAEQVADDELRDKLLADLAAMSSLVREGLAYARTDHAAQEVPCAVDLDALLDSLVCERTDAGHSAHLEGRLGTPLVTRPQALRRVVDNLLDNAIKFGGSAQVVVEHDAHRVHIGVRDRGPGIAPEQLDAVLQPFVRGEPSRNRDTGGTGLGLSIAHRLAQALRGRLRLMNREGGGLDAWVDLPIHHADGQ